MNIVITGATGAIGSALATLVHARGEKLLLCGRSDEKLETLNRALGGAHHTVAADLTDATGCAVLQATKAQVPAIAVLTSSVVAEAGFANHEAIAAAKCAVTGLALSAAATYADKGVRVNVVAPGLTRSTLTQRFIATPEAEARSAAMIPTNRIGEPDDVAHAFSYLLSPHAAHITGQVIRVDGGQGVLRPLPRAIKA